MPGPPPKDPKLRQRKNKVSTRATLTALADSPEILGRLSPHLPERGRADRPWHAMTLEFWQEVWASPMVGEYIPADVPGLILVAELVDRVHYGDTSVAAEIRLQRQCFGLTPLDRRRLQWEIARGEDAEKRRKATVAPCAGRRGKDPRSYLRAIK